MVDQASTYILNFTDPTKDPIVINPGQKNEGTSLVLFGNGALRWGESVDENQLQLLENYASPEDSGNPGNPQAALVPNPIEGQMWFNSTQGVLNVYRTQGSPTGWLPLADADTLANEYYDKTQSDARFVNVAGDTMTGFLTLNADPTAALHSATKQYVDTSIPAGALVSWVDSSAPTGWLLCDGSSYLTATYPNLFAVIGYKYGGSGANFNVPDMRGRFPVGLVSGSPIGADQVSRATPLGFSGGTEYHTLVQAELPTVTPTGTTDIQGSHTHTGSTSAVGNHNHGISWASCEGGGGDNEIRNWTGTANGVTGPGGAHSHTMNLNSAGSHSHTLSINSFGSDQQHENTPPFMTVNFIIKHD